MYFLHVNGFDKYEDEAWTLTIEADADFVPPLSGRQSTVQNNLNGINVGQHALPTAYFEQLKQQSNLLAVENGKLAAFMSYMPGHELGYYVSTIIVDKKLRNRGIAKSLYEEMILCGKLPLATRTWSRNYAHLHILEQLGFEKIKTIKNDRAEGIDTVYYRLEERNKQTGLGETDEEV